MTWTRIHCDLPIFESEEAQNKYMEEKPMTEQDLIEQLAEKHHESWSRWMNYLFSKCMMHPDGSVRIPHELVVRWKTQTYTDYEHLSEQEKQSDREEVARILPIINKWVQFENDIE